MLIVNIKTNRKELIELYIWNTGEMMLDKETCIYKIIKPTEYNKHTIFHKRADGFALLARKALELVDLDRKVIS